MWFVEPAQEAWHVSVSNLTTHTAFCSQCQRVDRDGVQPINRCPEGQKLYAIEQGAYGAWISDRYAGRAA